MAQEAAAARHGLLSLPAVGGEASEGATRGRRSAVSKDARLGEFAFVVAPFGAAVVGADAGRAKTYSCGVLIRYHGNDATHAQAKQALADCKAIRRAVRGSLGLSG